MTAETETGLPAEPTLLEVWRFVVVARLRTKFFRFMLLVLVGVAALEFWSGDTETGVFVLALMLVVFAVLPFITCGIALAIHRHRERHSEA